LLGERAHTASIPLPGRGEIALGGSARIRASVGRLPVALSLLGIVVASTALRLLVASQTAAPWIFPDELVYSHLARSFAATGHFAVRDQPFSAWSFGPLYPILIAPFYRLGTPATAYLLIKTLNCVLFSAAAVPAYLLARRMLTRKSALILAAAAVFIPSGIYASKVMTESLAYPLFILAALTIVRVLEERTWKREIAAIAAIALAALSRGQLAVLLPAFLSTLLIVSIFDQRDEGRTAAVRQLWRRLTAYRITLLAAFGLVSALAVASMTGASGQLAGGHGEAFASVSLSQLAASFIDHLVELDVYLAILPFIATAIVSALAFRRRSEDRALRIMCALTITTTILLAAASARYLVAVSPSSSDPTVPVFDRYVFYVVPLFLILFLVWLERGRPLQSSKLALWLGVAIAAIPLVLPYGDLLNGRQWGTNSSTVGLVPLGILRMTTGTLFSVYALLIVGGACLTRVFLRSKNSRQLILIVALNFAVLNLLAQAGNSAISRRALRLGVGGQVEKSWIDAAAGKDAKVAALWAGTRKPSWKAWYTIWENEFFNVSVRRAYRLREPMQYALPVTQLHLRGRSVYLPDGRRFVAQYVLTDVHTPVNGTRIAVDGATRMALYRVDGPVRLR
jgi:hypothetical protein